MRVIFDLVLLGLVLVLAFLLLRVYAALKASLEIHRNQRLRIEQLERVVTYTNEKAARDL